jgi:acyl-CoA synthetase (AMP-forming)/AMP-acid ligase II
LQVEAFLEDSARRCPTKVALVCGERRLTYADIDREADRVAQLLREYGVRRGDRVVIHLDNSVEAVVALFAILKAGAVFIVVNPSMKVDKLAYI